MKQHIRWTLGATIIGLTIFAGAQHQPSLYAEDASSYSAEKAKALANPYPNDLGPATIDVSGYPAEMQETYKTAFQKCSRCHELSRPLNSQFLEPSGEKPGQAGKVAAWKQSNPEMFKDKLVWQIEPWTSSQPGIWERYVKKMMGKPGCNITPPEGKKIWQFLTYDSEKRKTGANAAKWAKHRRKLLADFKAAKAARYRELFETN